MSKLFYTAATSFIGMDVSTIQSRLPEPAGLIEFCHQKDDWSLDFRQLAPGEPIGLFMARLLEGAWYWDRKSHRPFEISNDIWADAVATDGITPSQSQELLRPLSMSHYAMRGVSPSLQQMFDQATAAALSVNAGPHSRATIFDRMRNYYVGENLSDDQWSEFIKELADNIQTVLKHCTEIVYSVSFQYMYIWSADTDLTESRLISIARQVGLPIKKTDRLPED